MIRAPQLQDLATVICTLRFRAAAINSASSPYLKVGFFISSLPWETRHYGWWMDCVSGLLGKLCLLPSGFAILDRGPSLVGALKTGNLSGCHVFHPVLIYACLREEEKVFCLSNHLLCMLLLLNLFSLVTVVKVCTPLSIMHWVNWMLVHTLSFCKKGAQCSEVSKGNSRKRLKTIFFLKQLNKQKKDFHLKLAIPTTDTAHANMPILTLRPEPTGRLWTHYTNPAWYKRGQCVTGATSVPRVFPWRSEQAVILWSTCGTSGMQNISGQQRFWKHRDVSSHSGT